MGNILAHPIPDHGARKTHLCITERDSAGPAPVSYSRALFLRFISSLAQALAREQESLYWNLESTI